MHKKWLLQIVVPAVALVLLACSSSGLPKQAGQYDIQPKSLAYDGEEYSFYWVDRDKSVHLARMDDIKMVQDSRTFLDVQGDEPILHLAEEDPITVRGEDRRGPFDTFWFPFLMGQMLAGRGPVVINQPYPGSPETPRNVPTYHYPPAGSFGRDDTLNGSVTNSKPSSPNYERVAPAPYAVSGKSGGAGAGTAATGKQPGDISGQAGGVGTGTAVSEKGGFRSGTSSFSSKSGGASSPKVGGGSGRSSGGGGKAVPSFGGGRAGGGARGGGK